MTNTDDGEEEKVIFRTKDLNQAAFIWCQPGVNILKLEGDGKQKSGGGHFIVHFVFEFPENADLAKLIIDYANGKTLVEPMMLCAKQNSLRDLLHGLRKRPKRNRT